MLLSLEKSRTAPANWNDNAPRPAAPEAAVCILSGIVTSALRQRQPLTGREVPFLRQRAQWPIKITLPSAHSSRSYLSSTAPRILITGIRRSRILKMSLEKTVDHA